MTIQIIEKMVFSRNTRSIEGKIRVFYEGGKVDTFQARSGQVGFLHTCWVRGKSPTPFGSFFIQIPSKKQNQWSNTDGIGEFFNVYSSPKNKRVIRSLANPTMIREDVGIHPENLTPGSIGCPVLVAGKTNNDQAEKTRIQELFKIMNAQKSDIPFYVENEV
jgi:hypothetical protein